MRLDNIVFRLGFAPTMSAARQLIRHGHLQVNGKKATIPSYQCKPSDNIDIVDKKATRAFVTQNLEVTSNRRVVPSFLTVDKAKFRGTVNRLIDRLNVGLTLNELLIVEYYSRKV
jgi:small subunit ribosomal protein S4